MRPLEQLVRRHILAVKPYSSARSEYPTSTNDSASTLQQPNVFLDANENAFGSPAQMQVNRYPDPLQTSLKRRIAEIKGLVSSSGNGFVNQTNSIFIGNGSDEPIDLLIRAFCEPMSCTDTSSDDVLSGDEIIIMPPTYGMYEVSAAINNVRLVRVPLIKNDNGFLLNTDAVLQAITPRTKLIFLCSPNNPTANLLEKSDVERIIAGFDGVVIVDEAYIDFAAEHSFVRRLSEFPNLVVLQTFSKAWGMAGLRLGMAFASEEIVAVLNKIKPPYNINILAQEAALTALSDVSWQKHVVEETLRERMRLERELSQIAIVRRVFPSDANFLLVEVENAREVYEKLVAAHVIVRDRSSVQLCEDCLRITVGTMQENMRLLKELATMGR